MKRKSKNENPKMLAAFPSFKYSMIVLYYLCPIIFDTFHALNMYIDVTIIIGQIYLYYSILIVSINYLEEYKTIYIFLKLYF